MTLRIRQLVLIVAAALLVGCGGSGDEWSEKRPKVVPVSGTVLYKDQPVEGATVLFLPKGHNNAAAGQTDAEGRFQLQTFAAGDGAVPGEYQVTVRKVEATSAAPSPQQDDAEAPPREERSLLPAKYGKAESSGLTATVTEGAENNVELKLTD